MQHGNLKLLMVEKKLNTDQYYRSIVSEHDICQQLYHDANFNYDHISIQDPTKYNNAVDNLFLPYTKLKTLEETFKNEPLEKLKDPNFRTGDGQENSTRIELAREGDEEGQ